MREEVSGEEQVEYREVPGWPNYRVDSAGGVWSCYANRGGRGESQLGAWHKLTPSLAAGYLVVTLCDNPRRTTRQLHRVILESFRGPCPPGYEARHLNGDWTDNRLENLEWNTHKVNVADKIHHGTSNHGERNNFAKLTENQVKAIRMKLAAGVPRKEIAKEFGVTKGTINSIVQRRTWAHVSL